jgi:hypothetical protein
VAEAEAEGVEAAEAEVVAEEGAEAAEEAASPMQFPRKTGSS